ncbi:MAG: hypothetical protein OEV49_14360 [candidate division Zixibacteria bacterium]|nr:hypothetical protein [candidate division Zixibacteria bacterium]MDH3939029.1 hypothetical protein [candidate division Zixibacteria bacterium]MDH4033271.1 hypothetical protein [candidate division Zixibacteria bacterium]
MKSGIRFAVVLALIVAISIMPMAQAFDATPVPELIGDPIELVQPVSGGEKSLYQGTLRIYMSEPVSRYTDLNNDNYAFGMLDWAGPTVTLSINDLEVYTHVVQWDASDNGFYSIDPDNLVAQSVVFNATPYTQYSDPPSGNPFFAYWAEAAAMAAPGAPGQNISNQDYTHTVFVEELTQKY